MYGTLMYGMLKSWRIDLRSAPQNMPHQQTEKLEQKDEGGGNGK